MKSLPDNGIEFLSWAWADMEPHYQALLDYQLDGTNVDQWLTNWTTLSNLIAEAENRHYVATSVDTADEKAEAGLKAFLDTIYPEAKKYEQALKTKLLESGIEPKNFETAMRNMRSEADLYREENVSIFAELIKLSTEFDQVIGAQTVVWEGKEVPLQFLGKVQEGGERSTRETAWRLASSRVLQDRAKLNDLWAKMFELRRAVAANAGKRDFQEYMWSDLYRFDYTPRDVRNFREAIAEVVVPAATELYKRKAKELGIETLRPWDTEAAVGEPLRPFQTVDELVSKAEALLDKVDPELGAQFSGMNAMGLLDLESRMNKAPGGYCTGFDVAKQPFIFMNAVGRHDDLITLVHEAGHAFHVFATADLPYRQHLAYTSEIAEVASMSMEFLSGPFLSLPGGFYDENQAAAARKRHLEKSLLFWPYMAVVDGFQDWAYANPSEAVDSSACDQAWGDLWNRFMPGIDYSGLDDSRVTGWHRKLHIFSVPFYYVEYGIAQLGAVQVWKNSQADFNGAVQAYRNMLALGGSRPLPELFKAAGAKFAFDKDTISSAVNLMMTTIDEL